MIEHWSDKYLGKKYSADEFDCAALASEVAAKELGVELGLPPTEQGYANYRDQLFNAREDYATRIDQPIDKHPVLFLPTHIGIMCDIGGVWYVLHADRFVGMVIRQRVAVMTRFKYRLEGYYRWRKID